MVFLERRAFGLFPMAVAERRAGLCREDLFCPAAKQMFLEAFRPPKDQISTI